MARGGLSWPGGLARSILPGWGVPVGGVQDGVGDLPAASDAGPMWARAGCGAAGPVLWPSRYLESLAPVGFGSVFVVAG